MKDFDAVVFDMDGVIFDSERVTLLCWLELADRYGIQGIEKPYLACTGTNAAKTRQIMLDAYGVHITLLAGIAVALLGMIIVFFGAEAPPAIP